MKRILFVDDEPMVLGGLRNMLRSQRREWDMVFAPGPEEALAELERASFDIIVTDMRMPGMDGNALLAIVKKRWPGMVRFILSGHTDLEALLQSVSLAHQFLAKPCDPEVLKSALERACTVQNVLNNSTLIKMVGEIDRLPSAPRIYLALSQALVNPEVQMDELARIVEQDIAMCAKLMQIVNSAFFGVRQRITDIHQAVKYLGIAMLKNLVLSIEIFNSFENEPHPVGISLGALQNHSLLTAQLAEHLLPQRTKDAFMAGMLHDVGILVLAYYRAQEFSEVMAKVKEEGLPQEQVERAYWGVTHAEVGAYLLGLWGLPWPIVEAVAFHHSPWKISREGVDLPDALYIADVLAHQVARADSEANAQFEPGYIEGKSLVDAMPGWRHLALDLAYQAQTPLT